MTPNAISHGHVKNGGVVQGFALNGAGIMAPLDVSLSDQERNGRQCHSGQNTDHEPIRRLALLLRFHSRFLP
jgi:hypothetical protein